MQLFYLPEIDSGMEEVVFSKDESRHLVQVLRKREGDTVTATNGRGLEVELQITSASPKSATASVLERKLHGAPSPRIHMAVAPTKMNDRFEWFLEKATEIGVDRFTPLICERSERRKVKLDRFQRVVDSAAKQSLKRFFPIVEPPMDFGTFMAKYGHKQGYIAHCMEGKKSELFKAIETSPEHIVLIGPEGDFTPAELELALEKDYVPVGLGQQRLRTETAAVVAAHSIVLGTRILR
jgi:16S rRNA (uracil1498-N3)-methyltransferase